MWGVLGPPRSGIRGGFWRRSLWYSGISLELPLEIRTNTYTGEARRAPGPGHLV